MSEEKHQTKPTDKVHPHEPLKIIIIPKIKFSKTMDVLHSSLKFLKV